MGILGYTFQDRAAGATKLRHERLIWNVAYHQGEIDLGHAVLMMGDPDDPSKSEIDRFDTRSPVGATC